MRIDPDANVSRLLESWENGNRNDVITALANDHPGLTAFFLVAGIGGKMLNRSDANIIANRLMDIRIELGQQGDVSTD